jgi:hypothetical protein
VQRFGEAELVGAPNAALRKAVTVVADVMPAEGAEWIREHVWTPKMRETFREVPGAYLRCACQHGTTHWCRVGRHDRCHGAAPLPDNETAILDCAEHPRYLPQPFEHLVLTGATGPRPSREALVWLADRTCRWVCPCSCHGSLLAGRADVAVGQTFDIFGGVA